MAESRKKLKISLVFFVVYYVFNRNRSAQVRELLSNNLLLVCQFYKDKSPALCAHNLIFTTDLKTELLLINSLLELIYSEINFLIYLPKNM